MGGDTVTFGQQPNPLVTGSIQPLRYSDSLELSEPVIVSTGALSPKTIKFNELQYVDYGVRAFEQLQFHAFEQTNTKQGMARVSVYPFGARWRSFWGWAGVTGFYRLRLWQRDRRYQRPSAGAPPLFNAPKAHITRWSALVHYNSELWGLAFEYDQGHNAFSEGNLFSASACG